MIGDLLGAASHRDAAQIGPEGYPIDWHGVRVFYLVKVADPSDADGARPGRIDARGPLVHAGRGGGAGSDRRRDRRDRRCAERPLASLLGSPAPRTASIPRARRAPGCEPPIRLRSSCEMKQRRRDWVSTASAGTTRVGSCWSGSLRTRVPGLWQLPGGGVDHGEDPVRALVREFAEETGLTSDRACSVRSDGLLQPARAREGSDSSISTGSCSTSTVAGGALRPESRGRATPWPGSRRMDDPPAYPLMALDRLGSGVDVRGRRRIADGGRDRRGRATPVVADVPVTHVQRFAAYGLAADPAGRILLTRIAPGYPGAGTWHLPGGGTDFGEIALPRGSPANSPRRPARSATVGELLSDRPPPQSDRVRAGEATDRLAHRTVSLPCDCGDDADRSDRARAGRIDRRRGLVHQADDLSRLNLNRFAKAVISEYARDACNHTWFPGRSAPVQ